MLVRGDSDANMSAEANIQAQRIYVQSTKRSDANVNVAKLKSNFRVSNHCLRTGATHEQVVDLASTSMIRLRRTRVKLVQPGRSLDVSGTEHNTSS